MLSAMAPTKATKAAQAKKAMKSPAKQAPRAKAPMKKVPMTKKAMEGKQVMKASKAPMKQAPKKATKEQAPVSKAPTKEVPTKKAQVEAEAKTSPKAGHAAAAAPDSSWPQKPAYKHYFKTWYFAGRPGFSLAAIQIDLAAQAVHETWAREP